MHVLRKIHQIRDRLLHGQKLQARDREVRTRVRIAKEAVLDHDRGTVLLLSDQAVDRRICQVPLKSCICVSMTRLRFGEAHPHTISISLAGGGQNDWPAYKAHSQYLFSR